MTSAALTEDHLAHPPVALIDMVPANNHKMPRSDMEEGSFKLDGKVAVIEGQAGVFAAGQRTQGFKQTIEAAGKFDLVASVPANWSREQAYNACSTILQQHPDLIGVLPLFSRDCGFVLPIND